MGRISRIISLAKDQTILTGFPNQFYYFRCLCSMTSTSSDKLAAVPDVDIDPEGTFKYVLMRVYGPQAADGQEPSKLIVRGYSRAPFHSDVYDEVTDRLKGLGLDTECTGGGRIQHNPGEKSIKIYGYSQGFGRADHAKSAELVKVAFPDYDVTCTNDGY